MSLFKNAIVALVVGLVLGAISVSGVQSAIASDRLMEIAFSIFALSLVAVGVARCPSLNGTASALLTVCLLVAICLGLFGAVWLTGWLHITKTAQLLSYNIGPPTNGNTPVKSPNPFAQPSRTSVRHKVDSKTTDNLNLAQEAEDLSRAVQHLSEYWAERSSSIKTSSETSEMKTISQQELNVSVMKDYEDKYRARVNAVHAQMLNKLKPEDEDLIMKGYYDRGFNADSLALNASDLNRLAAKLSQ